MTDFGKLGFGFLRLPQMDDGTVDLETTKKMVDRYLSRGFRYFDTAYIYQNGKNEEYLRQALVERYPRDSFFIADKLPCGYLRNGRTAEEIFEDQLRKCGVEYFDVYLLHGLDGEDAAYAEEMGCFELLAEQKRRGRVRYAGFSFHDTAEVLDGILTRHPEAASGGGCGPDPAELPGLGQSHHPVRGLLGGLPPTRQAHAGHGAGEGRHSCVDPGRGASPAERRSPGPPGVALCRQPGGRGDGAFGHVNSFANG